MDKALHKKNQELLKRSNITVGLADIDYLCYAAGFACEKSKLLLFKRGADSETDEPIHEFVGKDNLKRFFEKNLKKKLPRSWWNDSETDEELLGDWVVHEHIEVEPVENCYHTVKAMMNTIKTELGLPTLQLYLTGPNNYREDIATLKVYKGNRDKLHRPQLFQAIRDYLVEQHGADVIEGQEADDEVAIRQWADLDKVGGVKKKCSTVIISIDKDLNCVPGFHYNPDNQELYWTTYPEAYRHFYKQMVTGDNSDNIPGLFQITGKRKPKDLEEQLAKYSSPADMWKYVVELFESKSVKIETDKNLREILTETGILLHMRTERDEIWSPPV